MDVGVKVGVRVYIRGCRGVGVGNDVGVSDGAGDPETYGVAVEDSVGVAVGGTDVAVNVSVTSEPAGILKWEGIGELHASGPITVAAAIKAMIAIYRLGWERFPMKGSPFEDFYAQSIACFWRNGQNESAGLRLWKLVFLGD